MTDNKLKDEALAYHLEFPYGKISVNSKHCTAHEMRFAYSPGVAYACQAIQENPVHALKLTSKGNNVTVITNGTAVLGLGDIGALAGKPVMEGKALLMNTLAGIDASEICVNEKNVDELDKIINACSDSFGCINLEDIKAPECFELLERLQEKVNVPVFHDDQDGTATVAVAGLLNALHLQGKNISNVVIVCSGAGAAMLATLRLMEQFGLKPENVRLFDSKGLVYNGRDGVSEYKQKYAYNKPLKMQEALHGADVFLGLSVSNVITGEDIKVMAEKPVILAMANPTPEIMPEDAKQARPDVIIGTGRSDYPNQVNNSSCFPYLFRGILDAQAKKITLNVLKGVVEGLMSLAKSDPDFGPEKILPNILDSRLPYGIVKNVIDATIKDGVSGMVDRFAMHMYLYKTTLWNRIINAKPRNNIEMTGLDADCLESYIEDFLDDDMQNDFTAASNVVDVHTIEVDHCGNKCKGKCEYTGIKFVVENVEKVEFLNENKDNVYLFKNGLEIFTVSPNGTTLFDLPAYNDLNLNTAKDLHDFIGCVDLSNKKAYVENNLRKMMFMGALLSRV